LWKLYWYKFLSDFWLIAPVFVPVGLAIYALSASFWAFVLAEAVLAVAASMRSGTDSAMLYDTLLELKDEGRYQEIEGKMNFYTRLGSSSSAVLGGLLAVAALRLPFWINVVSGVVMVVLAFWLREPARVKRESATPFRDILKIVRYTVAHRKIRWLMVVSAGIFSTGIIGVWSYYMYYGNLGLSVGLYGILFAVFGFCSGLGAKYSHVLMKKMGDRLALAAILLIGPGLILLGFITSYFMIPVIYFIGFVWGFSYPMLMGALNDLIESEVRATVISVVNMAGSVFFVVLSPIFGRAVDIYSLGTGHVALGIWFLLLISFALARFKRVPADSAH
jgi:MFS family permease